jgi:acyl-CoA thioesterase
VVSDPLPSSADAMWSSDRASQSQGIRLDLVEDGHAVVAMTVAPNQANGLGVCHGGLIFLLADTAMAFASNSTPSPALAAGASIEFLQPAQVGDVLRATAVRSAASGRTSHWTVDVIAESANPASASPASANPVSANPRRVALFHGRTVQTQPR